MIYLNQTRCVMKISNNSAGINQAEQIENFGM